MCRASPLVLLALFACDRASHAAAPAPKAPAGPPPPVLEVAYAGKLENGWMDYGWSPHDQGHGPAKVDLSNYGGWILGKPGDKSGFGGLRFSVSVAHALKVEMRLEGQGKFTRVYLDSLEPVGQAKGLNQYFVPMSVLNPRGADFEQIVFQGREKGALKDVLVDDVGLTGEPAGGAATAAGVAEVKLQVDCAAAAKPISPGIYGVAFDSGRPNDDSPWAIGATARRWGGNASSRYNWKLHAWNAGNDWFFRNLEYTGIKDYTYETYLEQTREHGLKVALSIPMLGWVAKDRTSSSFPVAIFANQQQLDPTDPTRGNGRGPDGTELPPGPPALTSIPAPPEFMQQWVEAIRAKDKSSGRGRAVSLYFLDNEPNLWSETHRDVHPEPLSYDELWEKTVAYAHAIRAADPDAVIAGPCEWGWTNYFYSALDMKRGGPTVRLDRRKHDDLPLIAWYLKKAAEHEKKTGERVIDVLDLHFYPQAQNIGIGSGGGTDPSTAARRLRTTRGLWDPTYKDESWIAEPIRLLPRMKEWIDT